MSKAVSIVDDIGDVDDDELGRVVNGCGDAPPKLPAMLEPAWDIYARMCAAGLHHHKDAREVAAEAFRLADEFAVYASAYAEAAE